MAMPGQSLCCKGYVSLFKIVLMLKEGICTLAFQHGFIDLGCLLGI